MRVNERGNEIEEIGLFPDTDRYQFDFDLCSPDKGWRQYDTDQDASYFGIWVNLKRRIIMSFVEGDVSRTICPTQESFCLELAHMHEFYGPPPAAATAIGNDGSVTKYYDTRPTGLEEDHESELENSENKDRHDGTKTRSAN